MEKLPFFQDFVLDLNHTHKLFRPIRITEDPLKPKTDLTDGNDGRKWMECSHTRLVSGSLCFVCHRPN